MSEKTEKGPTSAEIKKQIEEATKAAKEQKIKTDLVNSGLPLVAIADQINANSTTETPKAESKSQPAQAPAEPATEKATVQSVDLKEWAKKKGINWEAPESVLFDLRKKEQEFHRKRAEEKKRETVERPPYANGWTPNQTPPPYQPANPYPTYAPPQRVNVDDIARSYNMTAEDFNRVAPLTRDMINTFMQQERQRQAQEMDEIKRENIKNSEFRELSADPVFRKPEVYKEFQETLEQMQDSDPESFSQDPYAYRKAFDRALQNIGRRNLEGVQSFESTPFSLPKTPPRPVGTGSGGGMEANENGLTQSEYNRLSVDEQRKYLESMGLVQSKY